MATEEYQVGYEAGYQDGWNAAQQPQAELLKSLEGLLEAAEWLTSGFDEESLSDDVCRAMQCARATIAKVTVSAAPQQAEAVPPDVVRDAERYRWLRDKGFAYADVDLGSDFDEDTFVSYRIKFNVPEPAHYKFEDDEWTAADIDAAIDAAIAAQGAKT